MTRWKVEVTIGNSRNSHIDITVIETFVYDTSLGRAFMQATDKARGLLASCFADGTIQDIEVNEEPS
jgi:hypothetical protein